MNAFTRSTILSVIILFTLTSCMAYAPGMSSAPQILAGDVQGLSAGTAKMIAEQALNSAPGSSIWFQGDNYIFGAPLGSNFGWVILDTQGTQPIDICQGNISSCATFQGLVTFLIKQGWRQLAVLPEYTVTLLEEYAGALTTPMVIVTGAYSPLPTGIKQ